MSQNQLNFEYFSLGNPKVYFLEGHIKISDSEWSNICLVQGVTWETSLNSLLEFLSYDEMSFSFGQVLMSQFQSLKMNKFLKNLLRNLTKNFLIFSNENLQDTESQEIDQKEFLQWIRLRLKEALCQPEECPVCLEKIYQDQRTIIGTLCGHLFHKNCLFAWHENTCPVCRFECSPSEPVFCELCQEQDRLWLCLTCGMLACGLDKPTDGHTLSHFEETDHSYWKPLDPQIQGVFDQSIGDFIGRFLIDLDRNLIYGKDDEGKEKVLLEEIFEQFSKDLKMKTKRIKEEFKQEEKQTNNDLEQEEKFFKERLSKFEKFYEKRKKLKKRLQSENQQLQQESQEINKNVKEIESQIQDQQESYSQLNKQVQSQREQYQQQDQELQQELVSIDLQIREKLQEYKDLKKHMEIEEQFKGQETQVFIFPKKQLINFIYGF